MFGATRPGVMRASSRGKTLTIGRGRKVITLDGGNKISVFRCGVGGSNVPTMSRGFQGVLNDITSTACSSFRFSCTNGLCTISASNGVMDM